jgi:hypothetical protein
MRKALLTLLALMATSAYAGAEFEFRNLDGPNEGFNDPTPIAPTAGNPATTLGAARINMVMEAMRIWGALIHSDVRIVVEATFDPFGCSAAGGALGMARPTLVIANFPNAPRPSTDYPFALADALAGENLGERYDSSRGSSDITAAFNSSWDSIAACGGLYYGLDHNEGGKIDILATAMHEIAHGLGFVSHVNPSTGSTATGKEILGAYDHFVYDESLGTTWPNLTATQRIQSAVRDGQLSWSGPNANARLNRISAGATAAKRLKLYAPNPARPGSSVSHWDVSMTPNALMEPFATNDRVSQTDAAVCLLKDLGWQTTRCPDFIVNTAPVVSAQTVSTLEDTALTISIAGSDANQDPLSYLVTSAPAHGTVANAFAGLSNTFVYTPSANANGPDTLTITASDGMDSSVPATVIINVIAVNDAPVAPTVTSKVQSGQSVSINLSATDVDNTALTYSVATNPTSGTVTVAGSVATYQPNTGFTGTDTFVYRASDGAAESNPATVTVTVTAPQSSDGGGGAIGWLLACVLAGLRLARARRFPRMPG